MKSKEHIVIAVDLGGTNLQCACADEKCTIVKHITKPSLAHLDRNHIIENIQHGISDIISLSGLESDSIDAIGIGAPGIINTYKGIIHRAANFPDWKDVPLADILSEEFNLPVYIGHDVDLAVLAETYYGAGRGKNHVICLTIGTGIGMGMVLDGRLYRGAHGGAGNLGHMVMDKDTPSSIVQNTAILEKLTAAPAIRAKAIASINQGINSILKELCGGDTENIDTGMIFKAAHAGDGLCKRIVEETARILGIGIANVINLLSPEIVIIGGGVASAGALLFDAVSKWVKEYVYSYPDFDVAVVPSQLGDKAVVIGAAHTAWCSLSASMEKCRG